MNEDIKLKILNKIKEYNRIIICRHIRPDGDAAGSTLGLRRILRLTYPQKEIYVINDDYSRDMAFLGEEDAQREDSFYTGALIIVIDTGSEDRVSNSRLGLAKEMIVIDHHIEREPYGAISWVEPERSSACEMVADFYASFKDELCMDTEAATCIYAGMVTDSGRFRFESVTGETLRLAAMLLDKNINTQKLFAMLYLDTLSEHKFHAYVLNKLKLTKNGVAYIYISLDAQRRFGLTSEQASNSVAYLNSLKGSIIWIAFIENEDGSIRVRLGSRFVTINQLAESYGGGGHAQASGATIYSLAEMRGFVRRADKLIEQYKSENDDWL